MAEHTPLPWKAEVKRALGIYAAERERPIAQMMNIHEHGHREGGDTDIERADAEFIVRACNAHDDLLAACKEFHIELCPDCEGSGCDPRNDADACRNCGGFGEIISGGDPVALRAAIAKAKGE